MKNIIPKCFNLIIICGFILILFSNPASGQDNGESSIMNKNWTNLKYALYFTYWDIERLLMDSASFNETMNYFAPIKFQRVYLEGSSHKDVDLVQMKEIANKFHDMGIEVTGAMVPVAPRGGAMCYNSMEDMAVLEKRSKALAQVFDTIILDDWLFTICTCDKCVKGRGKMSWADYRTKLIIEQSKKYIIQPAKKVNPKVKVIIKYPNWYEGHRQNGYDTYNETLLFDKMCVGIETRNPERQDQHIPIYSGYVFQKWFPGVDTSKWIGSWLDNYGMKGENDNYVAQVWQAVLAKTPEIILWCAGQLHSSGPSSDIYPHFLDMLPDFDNVAGLLNGPSRGVPIYLPYGSTGEYNIFGYLGLAGIPLEPVAEFPSGSRNAIFTLHSEQDPKLAEKMIARLNKGLDIFMTWGLWQKLQNTEFKNTLSLITYGGTVSSSEFRLREGWQEEIIGVERPFTFPRIETTTWPYVRDVAVVEEDYDLAVLMRTPYLNGTIYILNMPDNSYDLLHLPGKALNKIRRAFSRELEVELNGPGGVAIYLFGQKQYVLYNMSNKSAEVSLKFTKEVPTTGWNELIKGEELSVNQDTSNVNFGGPVITNVSLSLEPFEMKIVQAP